MTNPESNTAALTAEQLTLAAQLNERVKTLETQGSVATLAQARDLREIRDSELFRAIEKSDGTYYANFGEYVSAVTTKSPRTISQNISVVTTFSQYTDEQLAAAGTEKLDIARKMLAEGYYKTTDEALEAATRRSRSELIDIRKTSGGPANLTVALSSRKVVKAQATRFEEGFTKFGAIYTQVHNDPHNTPTDSQIMDFYLDVVNGLPNDFLMEAAAGEGGAAPEMSGGFTPQDVPVGDVVYFLAEQLAAQGRDPNEILDQLREGVQSVHDRFEVEKREREEQERERLRAEKEAAKAADKEAAKAQRERDKMVKLLGTVSTGYVITMQDGSVGEVVDVSADGNSLLIRGNKDTAEDGLFPPDSEGQYTNEYLADAGVESLKKPAKKKAEKEDKPEPEPEPTIGYSKEQQTGKKPRTPKKKAPAPESEEE